MPVLGEPDPASDRTLQELWAEVVEHWDDKEAHGRFLDACTHRQKLGEAAARYAAMRNDRVRGVTAQKHLEAVMLLAQMALAVTKRERRAGAPRWIRWLAFAIFGGLLAYGVMRLLRAM